MSLIDEFKTDFSKFFNDRARRGDSIENQLANSDKSIRDFSDESLRGDSLATQLKKSSLSINLFSTETKLLTQLQNSLDISSNSTFSTSPIEIPENGIGGFSSSPLLDLPIDSVNQSFPTSPLEESPTEDVGSVNFFSDDMVSGFTQFMVYPDTLYPGDGLNNSGIVDSFPSPHGKGQHNIEGFVADVQPLSDGFYPNTIELGSVDFFPGGPFTNNSNYATGFTENMQPFGGEKLITRYDINTFYQDQTFFPSFSEGSFPLGGFKVTSGTPSPGLSQYSAGLKSQFTSDADEPSSDVTWNLQIPAAGLGDTAPPYTIDQLKTSLPSMGIDTSGYDGAVNFFSNDDAVGFTKNMYAVGESKLPSQYTMFTDGEIGGEPSPSVTTYAISDSIFVGMVDDVENQFSVYTLGKFQPGNIAGITTARKSIEIDSEGVETLVTRTPFTFDELKVGMSSWNVGGFNIEQFTSFGTNVTGYTKGIYPVEDSNFAFTSTDTEGNDILELKLDTSDNIFSAQSYSADNIPSLVSVPRPYTNVSSGPVRVDSGFEKGTDFTLDTTSYLSVGFDIEEDPEGSIVRSVKNALLKDVRVNGQTLSDKFNDGKGTEFRDLSEMDASTYDYPSSPFGYSDGVSTGATYGSMYGSIGLIDTTINEVKAGLTPDFFIRESGGGRFASRILKDLERTLKRTLSPAGVMGLGKDAVMTLFNASEKSIYTNLITRFTTGNLGQFGIRGSSVASNILGLVKNSVFGVPDDNMALYERRVDSKHPSQAGLIGSVVNSAADLLSGGEDRPTRTLTTRYGQPKYPVHKALSKAPVAHKLYAGGMLDPEGTRQKNSFDKINIVSYGQGPDGVDNQKDLIKFNIRDVRNGKYIVLRAFLTNIQDSISPEWNNYRYVGRPDDVYVYKGTTRSVSFSLKVAAFSRREMIPMWEKINYLVGLNYGSFVDTNVYGSDDGGYYQGNPGMSSPICELTIGDYLTSQPGYIKDFNISVPPDYPWDVIIDDGGSNVIGELPQMVDINMGFQVIPQQIPDSYGKHFGKVGLGTDKLSSDGLPWLKDLYTNVPALTTFDTAHKKYMKSEDVKMETGETSSVADIFNSEEQQKTVTDEAAKGR